MTEQKSTPPNGCPNLAAAVSVAERVNRKKSDDNTAGEEDAPMLGPRERNREVELADALAELAEDEAAAERAREDALDDLRREAWRVSLYGMPVTGHDCLDPREDECAEPRRDYRQDDFER